MNTPDAVVVLCTAPDEASAQDLAAKVLAELASAHGRPVPRDRLLLHLWPESTDERARHALNQAMYRLRRELGEDPIIVGTADYAIDRRLLASDIGDLLDAHERQDQAAMAAAYRGPFLDGFYLEDAGEFERWVEAERVRYHALAVSAFEGLARSAAAHGDTARDLPEQSLMDLFEQSARAWPHRTALVARDATLTFAELNARANRLARLLLARGVGPETPVAIALPRSSDWVVTLFAVLKAGGAYVPLDLEYPAGRLRVMLADAAPALTVTTTAARGHLPADSGPLLLLDDPAIRDELAHVKLYAKQIKDRALLADATIFQMRAERRLGFLLDEGRKAGLIATSGQRRQAKDAPPDLARPATLEEIGIDKKLSAKAVKAAAFEETAFDDLLEAVRERIQSGRAITVDPVEVNGARAIMSSRVEADDSLDYFPTPPWATRALIRHVLIERLKRVLQQDSACEPACGEGHIAEVLSEFFAEVDAGDIHDYGYGRVQDFLADEVLEAGDDAAFDWYITNPPFLEKAEAFTLRALQLARKGVAIFVRLQWLETEGRYENIFRDHPPTLIAFFVERVNLCRGRWDPEGGTATAYILLDDPHYVLKVEKTAGADQGAVSFSEFDEAFDVDAPTPDEVADLSQLG